MFEKVNPSHPDKVADRIAGAIVDLAYKKEKNPRIAVEVLIGHGKCHIISETSVKMKKQEIKNIVYRIAGKVKVDYLEVPQDSNLAKNQDEKIRCGDNGIFKGVPLTDEQRSLYKLSREIYRKYPTDGKYIMDGKKIVICQSKAKTEDIKKMFPKAIVNPLGEWDGGTNVDSGATNRKLGSDMGDAVTGGGLHGKDLSKADVSINIYAFLMAQAKNKVIEISCAIGDEIVDGIPYSEIVKLAKDFIDAQGGFEKFAEWGLF